MRYSTDVTDAQWELIEPFLRQPRPRKPRKYTLREVYNALQYQVKNAPTWRDLPSDFPPWWAVYQQMARWTSSGALDLAVETLKSEARVKAGRQCHPSLAIIDSQTIKSTPESGQISGFDGGKKIQRHQKVYRSR